jgi:hypothetical protein
MIFKLIKKFSSWLNYKVWLYEVRKRAKKYKKEGKF